MIGSSFIQIAYYSEDYIRADEMFQTYREMRNK
jgi:hypothetical protein